MNVNAGKSKVMVCAMTERRDCLNLSLNGEIQEEVNSVKYLESIIGKNEGLLEDVTGRVNEEGKVSGATNRLWKVRSQGVYLKRMMNERIVVPSVLYVIETWG